MSCFEIYGGKLYDLLNGRQQLVMREDGKGRVCIVGLKEVSASSSSDRLVPPLMCDPPSKLRWKALRGVGECLLCVVPGAHCYSSLQVEVASSETIQELVSHANRARSTGSTGVNEDSSRSHSIMQVCS